MLLANFLDWEVKGGFAVDVLRFLGAMMGGGVIAFTILHLIWYHSRLSGARSAKYLTSLIAFTCFGVMVVLQEVREIGRPFLVWRLPLLLIGVANALASLWAREVHRFAVQDALRAVQDGEDPIVVLKRLEGQGEV